MKLSSVKQVDEGGKWLEYHCLSLITAHPSLQSNGSNGINWQFCRSCSTELRYCKVFLIAWHWILLSDGIEIMRQSQRRTDWVRQRHQSDPLLLLLPRFISLDFPKTYRLQWIRVLMVWIRHFGNSWGMDGNDICPLIGQISEWIDIKWSQQSGRKLQNIVLYKFVPFQWDKRCFMIIFKKEKKWSNALFHCFSNA